MKKVTRSILAKVIIAVIVIAVVLAVGFFVYKDLRTIGSVEGPEFNRLIIDNKTYHITNDSELKSKYRVRSKYLGRATYNGERSLKVYKANSDNEDRFRIAVWDWESFLYEKAP